MGAPGCAGDRASALIGGLIGGLLFAPLLGVALGAAAGATRAALVDLGIPDDFMQRLGQTLPPGSAVVMVRRRDRLEGGARPAGPAGQLGGADIAERHR